jgi:Succinylglutamate desuccinylase / Aspartoacylase family
MHASHHQLIHAKQTRMLVIKRMFLRRPALQSVLSISLLRLFTSVAMTVGKYPIGVAGVAWGQKEKAEWLQSRRIHRSYEEEVVSKVTDIDGFTTQRYGTLVVNNKEEGYPLIVTKSKNWEANKPSILITGGVHGYETSGVQGAIQFLKTKALAYSETFNVVVAPCISPWGYEVIERWNAQAVDPNRSFNPEGKVVEGRSFNPEAATQESTALIEYLKSLDIKQWMCHFDLHETTDTDQTEFRPAKRARDGEILHRVKEGEEDPDAIPDGFYLVSDSTNPQAEWHAAMIDAVRQVRLTD